MLNENIKAISGCFGAFHIHVNFPALGRKKKGRKSMNKEEKNMERYTLREGGRVLCPTERLEAALERLAAFEDLACGLEEEQQSISRRLEELRGQRKERTVQFRELLAQQLVNSSLIQLLERKGLK